MDDFQLEIAEFNKTQIKELLRLLDKIKIDDIKQLYLNSPEFQTKPFSIEQNLSYLFPKINKIKETLNKALTNNYISYNELVEIMNFLKYDNFLSGSKAISGVITEQFKFYFMNLCFDIDYILEKKLNPDIDFDGIKAYMYSYPEIKVKNYLSNYTITPFTQEEKIKFIDFENKQKRKGIQEDTQYRDKYLLKTLFLFNIKKIRNDDGTLIDASDRADYEYLLPSFNSALIYGGEPIKLSLITDEEVLKDIAKGVKNVFEKKEKREEYSTRIKRILESKNSIDHIELYENLNEYLQLFGNKEELDKLNEKYKSHLSIQIIKNKFIEIIQILTSVLKKIDDNEELKNVIELLITSIEKKLSINDYIVLDHFIIMELLLIQDIKNLYKSSYFHINSKPANQNLEFIIKTYEEIIDFCINYDYLNNMNNRGMALQYAPIQANRGGFKKILKKYK